MAAVRKRGSNLRFVTAPYLVDDLDVVLAACKQDGNSIQFVPKGPTRKTMMTPSYKRTILVNGGGAALSWKYTSKTNEEILLAAAENGCEIVNLDTIFRKNQPLFLKILQCSSLLYDGLPTEPQNDPSDCASCAAWNLNRSTRQRLSAFCDTFLPCIQTSIP